MIKVPKWYNKSNISILEEIKEYATRNGYPTGEQSLDEFIEQTLYNIIVLRDELQKLKNEGIQCKSCHQMYHLKE